MCMTAKECILRRAKDLCPNFDWTPHRFDHFYKIAEREGLQVVIDSGLSLDINIDNLPLTENDHILINAGGHIPEGDSLVCTYAKLFNYYYLNHEGLKNFHFCVKPAGQEYQELCLAAGFLAVAPCRMVLEDLQNGIDPCGKYQLSTPFARRRIQLILDYLTRLKDEDRNNGQSQGPYDEDIGLCEDYLAGLKKSFGESRF
jgi:hypothetical protein